ncbi:sterol desaturase family protein [Qipengyuania flava]|uniref:sterol desaturase family protein n=1 Tax=Qipengyuania flava TaxID=192812 RepID=UPI001E517095|nr:sterol desaturase family protein [Qipengyuania flava]
MAIVLLDVGITLAHFASHRVSFLWRFHAVHHSVRRMYGFNGLLKHPVHQFIEVTAGALPWLLLGIPLDVAAVASFAVLIQLQLQHSNVDMRVAVRAAAAHPCR